MKKDVETPPIKKIESVLTHSFSPVKPREEFIGALRHQLEEKLYPNQTKIYVSFHDFLKTILAILVIFLSGILVFRAIFIILGIIALRRKQPLRQY